MSVSDSLSLSRWLYRSLLIGAGGYLSGVSLTLVYLTAQFQPPSILSTVPVSVAIYTQLHGYFLLTAPGTSLAAVVLALVPAGLLFLYGYATTRYFDVESGPLPAAGGLTLGHCILAVAGYLNSRVDGFLVDSTGPAVAPLVLAGLLYPLIFGGAGVYVGYARRTTRDS